MSPKLQSPITYLITSGATTPDSNPLSSDFRDILILVSAAVKAGVSLIQLREKNLSAKLLYELTLRCAAITHKSETRLLVNDRADIARAARADGVHLTSRSIGANTIRNTFGRDFLIGVSVHSLPEALGARDGADFAVLGPVFDTPSKNSFGPPMGIAEFGDAAREIAPFPIIALGGVTLENATDVLGTDASGIAGIRLFSDPETLESTVAAVRRIDDAKRLLAKMS